MSKITASFAIEAGGYGEAEFDTTGMSPDEIAKKTFTETDVNTSLCHQCANDVIDPEVSELTGFTVDGVQYVQVDGHWQVDE